MIARRLFLLGVACVSIFGCAAPATPATLLHDGDGCSYSPLYIGQNGSASGPPYANITDIHEILDTKARTVGYLYRLTDKTTTLQGNALMSKAMLARYHLRIGDESPLYTGLVVVTPSQVRERVIACRRLRIQHEPVRGARVERDARQAYQAGKDFIDDPLLR